MNIIVCVKQLPDTETKPKIKEGAKTIELEGINWVGNPYDEYSIEEALRIKEKFSDSTVTLVTVGPQRAQEALRTGLAMGADTAVHILDDAYFVADSFVTANLLAAAIKTIPYDLIFCSHKAIDDDNVQVGARIAEALGLPLAYLVTKLEISEDKKKITVQKQVEGATVVAELALPALVTSQKGLNEPRYPSLPGIMKAKKKEIKVMKPEELGFNADQLGEAGSKIKIKEIFLPPSREAGKVLQGLEPAAAAKELVRLLHEEAKVI